MYNGKEYLLNRKIKTNKETYAEYRNEKLKKIKFFEINNDELEEIKDKEDLKKAITENYITEV